MKICSCVGCYLKFHLYTVKKCVAHIRCEAKSLLSPLFSSECCSGAMARGKTGNIAGSTETEENVKQVVANQSLQKSVTKTPEKKRLKFHNVFFDKVMEMKEVQMNKEPPKKSCRSKKRKATDELIIKEYNPARRRNEPPRKKDEGAKERSLKENVVAGVYDEKDVNLITTPCNLHMDLQAATATGPLDLRTRVREATPESSPSVSDSPGSSLQSSPEFTPPSTLRLGSPPPLEPLPTQTAPKCNSSKAASRPFAEGFMWQLICQLRQEAPKARKEDKATVPSG